MYSETRQNPTASPRTSDKIEDLNIRSSNLSVDEQVSAYLRATQDRYQPGQEGYYLRKSLEQALLAYEEGNYGIGSVALLVKDGLVYEFSARNAMVTGQGVHDHAETRALEDLIKYSHAFIAGTQLSEKEVLRAGPIIDPVIYSKNINQDTAQLSEGIHVFGTLEPCPMCTSIMGNTGVSKSTSTVLDGEMDENGRSLGAAMAIGKKRNATPIVWDKYVFGEDLEFELTKSTDEDLKYLSNQIFIETRIEIDQLLMDKKQHVAMGWYTCTKVQILLLHLTYHAYRTHLGSFMIA